MSPEGVQEVRTEWWLSSETDRRGQLSRSRREFRRHCSSRRLKGAFPGCIAHGAVGIHIGNPHVDMRKVHSDDISEFVENHREVLDRFGDSFGEWKSEGSQTV